MASNLIRQMQENADRTAFFYWDSPHQTYQSLTYKTLLDQAHDLAQHFKKFGLSHRPIIIALPQGLEFVQAVVACVLADVVFIPSHPVKIKADFTRLEAIAQASRASHILLQSSLGSRAVFHEPLGPFFLEGLLQEGESSKIPADLCFLQYSSGTTHKPKGVMISHDNLFACLSSMAQRMQLTSHDHGCIWIPPYQDLGLIGGILLPLYVGFPLTLMSPRTFILNPLKWLEIISEQRVTITAAPNFAYDLCVERLKSDRVYPFDLSSLRIALNAAEPIKPRTLRQFTDTFKPYGFKPNSFYPAYGLSESTLMVSAPEPLRPWHTATLSTPTITTEVISCGKPLEGIKAKIVHDNKPCRPNQVGEIFLAGPPITQGYWNSPSLTAEQFNKKSPHLFDLDRYFKTGDLGFMDESGCLFIVGRQKDQFFLNNQIYMPEYLEDCVLQCFGLDVLYKTAAFVTTGSEGLIILQEVPFLNDGFKEAKLKAASALYQQFGITSLTFVLVKRGNIPVTLNGKVKRHAAKVLYEYGVIDILSKRSFEQSCEASPTSLLFR